MPYSGKVDLGTIRQINPDRWMSAVQNVKLAMKSTSERERLTQSLISLIVDQSDFAKSDPKPDAAVLQKVKEEFFKRSKGKSNTLEPPFKDKGSEAESKAYEAIQAEIYKKYNVPFSGYEREISRDFKESMKTGEVGLKGLAGKIKELNLPINDELGKQIEKQLKLEKDEPFFLKFILTCDEIKKKVDGEYKTFYVVTFHNDNRIAHSGVYSEEN